MEKILFVLAIMVAWGTCIVAYILAQRHNEHQKLLKTSHADFEKWWYGDFQTYCASRAAIDSLDDLI